MFDHLKHTISTLLLLLCVSTYSSYAQQDKTVSTAVDLRIFTDYVSVHSKDKDKPIGELIIETGTYFSGKPYVASTLEVADPEKLVVNLREFDCTTFVESCLALARTLKDEAFDTHQTPEENFEIYKNKLREIRYRSGKLNGYPSRLHYFSDWISDNQTKGIVTDITQAVGGIKFPIEVGFMSANPDKYNQLKYNIVFTEEIAETEAVINSRTYYYIPKNNINKVQSLIKDGDIIAFTTNIPGLDISHVGYAIRQKGKLHLLHASLTGKKVVVSTQPLVDYTQSVRRHTGIMVVRPD